MHVTPRLCIATDSWIWKKLNNNDETFIEVFGGKMKTGKAQRKYHKKGK